MRWREVAIGGCYLNARKKIKKKTFRKKKYIYMYIMMLLKQANYMLIYLHIFMHL